MQAAIVNVLNTVALYGLKLLGAIVLLAFGWVVARWMQRAFRRVLDRTEGLDATLKPVLASLLRYLVLVLVLVTVLAQFGVRTASIVALLGAAGLAVGLALQGTLQNIAAGMMLLFLRPLKVGEHVDAEGHAGTVREIGLFTTELETFDGIYLSVPNASLWSRAIKNYSRLPTRRLDVVVGVGYGDDLEKAIRVLADLLQDDPRALAEPAPEVLVHELGESAVNLDLRCWAKREDYWALRFDLNKRAKQRLQEAGITIPFPQREVRLHTAENGS